MTSDRTQHVIDAIDGALGDWTVSSDAMRWAPDSERRPRASLHARGPVALYTAPAGTPPPMHIHWAPFRPDERATRRAFEQMGQAFGPLMEWAEQAAEALGMAASDLAALLAAAAEPTPDVPSPELEEPRTRALRLRQQRNTGPTRPTIAHRKRPRSV